MAFTYEQALSKIGTADYSGVNGLIRLVKETSAVADNATPNATTLLYSGDIGDYKAWQLINNMKNSFIDANAKSKGSVSIDSTGRESRFNQNQFNLTPLILFSTEPERKNSKKVKIFTAPALLFGISWQKSATLSECTR